MNAAELNALSKDDLIELHRAAFGTVGDTARTSKSQYIEKLSTLDEEKIGDAMIAANANVTGETLFWRGAAALVIADALTAAGYNVEIIAGISGEGVHSNGDNSIRLSHTVTVKPATAPLDKNALAAVVALSGYFRVFGFASLTSMIAKCHHALGHSIAVTPDEYGDAIKGLHKCTDQKSAQKFINDVLGDLTTPALAA